MPAPLHRRAFLHATGTLAATSFFVRRSFAAAPKATIDDVRVISHQGDLYGGWPTLARRGSGQLLLVWSGGRESHICPFGRVELMRSDDGGQSWSWPRVLLDMGIDDRDAGVLETSQGTLLVTTFTSLAYAPILQRGQAAGADWPEQRLQRWEAAHQRLTEEERQRSLGVWMMRSTDGGVNWSQPYDSLVNSPHGPVQLQDGRLLYAGKDLWRSPHRVGVCQSEDDGLSWNWLAEIPTRDGDKHTDYHELHAVDAGDGRLIVQIRNHNEQHRQETLQSESTDGGQTWSQPRSIGVWGIPSHLLRLADGRLLMTYGHRRPPLGNQARISEDHGRTWSEPIIVSGDGKTTDLGYPSTVQLDDGTLVTVWYEVLPGKDKAALRQARWRLS